ncbi:DUF4123 domain-containing protein [Ralstonia sp. 1138]|uniref:DUF4123 domain-containing protein n=1 Tax=Ralstonia sp. 1138 TaxID=3156423 RepID=UPI0033985E2B
MSHPNSPITPELLVTAVHEFQLANPSLQVCALVYGVAYPQLFGELRQWFGGETANARLALLFDASSEDGADQYGPYLVRLAPGAAQPTKLMTQLARCCVDDFRGVSFLFTPLDFEALVAGLRARLDVVCEDRSEWQMKFFDTRSLAVLDRTLSTEQRTTYFEVVKTWWYVDRHGNLQKIDGLGLSADTYCGPLQLTEQQTTAFVDAGLPDAVLHVLSQTDDDLLAAFDARTRYLIAEASIARAMPDERNSMPLLADRVRAALLENTTSSNTSTEQI